jgi:tripartite-type tricarboxylate transporter receptor subunit TctC
MNIRMLVLCAVGIGLLVPCATHSQSYPSRPIRLIVPSAPGGTPDIQARIIASELTKQMGQQVVVDNRAGASGIIGYETIAKAAPDGYTLGYAAFPFITNRLTHAKLPYDSERDFQPVVLQVAGTNILTVTPGLPVRSVRELADHARAHPGKLSYGSTGDGTSQQLSVELFKNMTGTQIVQVSYKGMQQAMMDTIAGQIQVIVENAPSIVPHVQAGRLRALGVTGLKRIPMAPDLPTISEAGLPGYEMAPSSGYVFPARTPRETLMRMNVEINKALKSPTFSEKVTPAGVEVRGGTPEQFAEHIRKETEKWGKVIRAAGIKPQ